MSTNEGTHRFTGKRHRRWFDGSPVVLVSGEVVTPTPQELAAFPDKFELISQDDPEPETDPVESGELSPELAGLYTVKELIALVDEGELSPERVLEAEESREKPRKSLVKRLKDRI